MADPAPSKLSYVMVVLASVAMIALGAHELERRFVSAGPKKNANMRELIQNLQGDTDEVHASISGKAVPSPKRAEGHEEGYDREELRNLLNKLVP